VDFRTFRDLLAPGYCDIIFPCFMERDLIRWLRERLPPHPLLRLGLGDDAAVLRTSGIDECVLTVDLLTDQVDSSCRRSSRVA